MRIFLPFAFLFCSSLNAQTTFAPTGAMWSYTQGFAFAPDSGLFGIECVGDNVIQGTNCSVLDYSGGISECMGFRHFVATTGESVVFWEPTDSTFRTLYVFGLSPGEGWKTLVGRGYYDLGTWVTVYDTLSFEVITSDVAVIDGFPLRRSVVQANWSPDWPSQNVPFSGTIIERLGHSLFMFPWIDGACDFEYTGPLRCYSDPDITWLNPQFPQCDLSVGMEEAITGVPFRIRPTLATTGETIQVIARRGTITVLDATGRLVHQLPIHGQGSFDLDTPGTYLVRFTAPEGDSTHQRIVVR